jgi:hypothetical protein
MYSEILSIGNIINPENQLGKIVIMHFVKNTKRESISVKS